jgi:hypothetical protein
MSAKKSKGDSKKAAAGVKNSESLNITDTDPFLSVVKIRNKIEKFILIERFRSFTEYLPFFFVPYHFERFEI